VRTEKVAAIKAALANGSYSSNAREIAERLFANGIGN
jgi:anti-sigma28 factor (negative regulator of flagellin synthesis)